MFWPQHPSSPLIKGKEMHSTVVRPGIIDEAFSGVRKVFLYKKRGQGSFLRVLTNDCSIEWCYGQQASPLDSRFAHFSY